MDNWTGTANVPLQEKAALRLAGGRGAAAPAQADRRQLPLQLHARALITAVITPWNTSETSTLACMYTASSTLVPHGSTCPQCAAAPRRAVPHLRETRLEGQTISSTPTSAGTWMPETPHEWRHCVCACPHADQRVRPSWSLLRLWYCATLREEPGSSSVLHSAAMGACSPHSPHKYSCRSRRVMMMKSSGCSGAPPCCQCRACDCSRQGGAACLAILSRTVAPGRVLPCCLIRKIGRAHV